jgi:hypothetical protein
MPELTEQEQAQMTARLQRLCDAIVARLPEAEELGERVRRTIFPDESKQVDMLTVLVACLSVSLLAAEQVFGRAASPGAVIDVTRVLGAMSQKGEELAAAMANAQTENAHGS